MSAQTSLFTFPPAGTAPVGGGANEGALRTWLDGLDKLEFETPYAIIGSALRRAGIIRPELWGDKPDFLQQGQLREALVKTGVKISDIEVTSGWKGRDATWWITQGGKLTERLQARLAPHARGVGDSALTADMKSGRALSPSEVAEVVQATHWPEFERLCAEGTFEEMKAYLATDAAGEKGFWAKRVMRAVSNFKDTGTDRDSRRNPEDFHTPRLLRVMKQYSETASKSMREAIQRVYTSVRRLPVCFAEDVHKLLVEYTTTAGSTRFEVKLSEVIGLFGGITGAAKACEMGATALGKALKALVACLNVMLSHIGADAGQLAEDVLMIWADVDPSFEQYPYTPERGHTKSYYRSDRVSRGSSDQTTIHSSLSNKQNTESLGITRSIGSRSVRCQR
jgi:hypothetical protein